MSTAEQLSQHPDQFDVTVIEAQGYPGGQAFSIPIDEARHGAPWMNQGVQGGSFIYHHTFRMMKKQGFEAEQVDLQVSFGKGDKVGGVGGRRIGAAGGPRLWRSQCVSVANLTLWCPGAQRAVLDKRVPD